MGYTPSNSVIGDLPISSFLGNFSTIDPSSNTGQWWYRTDLGIILKNVNGITIPMTSGSGVIIVDSNQTIGSTTGQTTISENIIVVNNAVLTIQGTIYFQANVTVTNGSKILSSNSLATSTAPQTNNYYFIGNMYLEGVYEIAQYNTDNMAYSTTNNALGTNGSITGLGTLSILSGITLTVNQNLTLSVSTISGSGTLSVGGNTITINGNVDLSLSTLNGTGNIIINSGYTLTLSNSNSPTFNTISGLGTLSVSSGSILNVSGSLSVSNIITNGTIYYIGSSITSSTTNAQATFSPSLSGSGIFIGANVNSGTASGSLVLSSTAIAINASDGTTNGTGKPLYNLTSVEGSAIGEYTIGVYNASGIYNGFVLLYIGTANIAYSVSGNYASTTVDDTGTSVYLYNMLGSAGTITLSGVAYV